MLVVVAKVFNKFEDGCAGRRILYHIIYEYSSLLSVEQENHNCEMITKASIEEKTFVLQYGLVIKGTVEDLLPFMTKGIVV